MSISGAEPKPPRIRRTYPPDHWTKLRVHYETDRNRISLRQLADHYGMPHGSVIRRAAAETWRRKGELFHQAKSELDQIAQEAISEAKSELRAEIKQSAKDELQPWIEKRKRAHIKSLVTLGERGVARVRKMMRDQVPTDSKDESFKAKTAETWDTIIRRNLGMSDSGGLSGSLSLNILTGSAAIQVNATPAGESG